MSREEVFSGVVYLLLFLTFVYYFPLIFQRVVSNCEKENKKAEKRNIISLTFIGYLIFLFFVYLFLVHASIIVFSFFSVNDYDSEDLFYNSTRCIIMAVFFGLCNFHFSRFGAKLEKDKEEEKKEIIRKSKEKEYHYED